MSEVVPTSEAPVVPAEILGAFVLAASAIHPAEAGNSEWQYDISTSSAEVLSRELIVPMCADTPLHPGHKSQLVDEIVASKTLGVRRSGGLGEGAQVTGVSLFGGIGRVPRRLFGIWVAEHADGTFADLRTDLCPTPDTRLPHHWQPRRTFGNGALLQTDHLNGRQRLLPQHRLYDPLRVARSVTSRMERIAAEAGPS